MKIKTGGERRDKCVLCVCSRPLCYSLHTTLKNGSRGYITSSVVGFRFGGELSSEHACLLSVAYLRPFDRNSKAEAGLSEFCSLPGMLRGSTASYSFWALSL